MTVVYRHRFATRVWHWVNAVAIFVLIGSGLGISNAHPRLYWGRYGANFDPAWWELPRFPAWLTIPANYNLALSRRWHLFFALVLAFGLLGYMVASLANRHFARDLRFGAANSRAVTCWPICARIWRYASTIRKAHATTTPFRSCLMLRSSSSCCRW